MLKNEYLVTKIGFDTAENEPSEIVKYGCWTTTDRAPCNSKEVLGDLAEAAQARERPP